MKFLITESKYNTFLDKLLEKEDIKVSYMYLRHNMHDMTMTGTVYLYKDGKILGYSHGYDFYYKYDNRFGSLTYGGHFPKIETLDIFRYLPSDLTIQYFSDNLARSIKKDVPSLFNQETR